MVNNSVFDEVYGVLGRKSVRGVIAMRDEESIVVTFENGQVVRYTFDEVGKTLFTSEKELIKKCGSQIEELAPLKRTELSEANDFFGLPVKNGDYLVAISGNPLYCRVEGTIEKIYKEFSEIEPEVVYVDLRKKSDQTFTKVELSDLCLQSRFC